MFTMLNLRLGRVGIHSTFFSQIVCTYGNFPNKKWGQLYRLETLEDTLANNSKKESQRNSKNTWILKTNKC